MPNLHSVRMNPLGNVNRRGLISPPCWMPDPVRLERKRARDERRLCSNHGGAPNPQPTPMPKAKVHWHTPPEGTIRQRMAVMASKLTHKAKSFLHNVLGG